MSTSAKEGTEKKLSLNEAADKIADEFPNIFVNTTERHLFKEDFKLMVRTYVMDDGSLLNFENTKQRRFAQLAAYDRVRKYDAKAKAAGRPTSFEHAKAEAVGRDLDDVSNMDEAMQLMQANPEGMKQVIGEVMAKLMQDQQKK